MIADVSVVIPSHNCLDYLPYALASVWAQSLEVREVWVVDDGSDDGTWDWLQQQRLQHPRLKTLRLDGVGCSAARNAAIKLCTSRWIAFLDADDSWAQDKIARQIKASHHHPDAVLLFSNYQHFDEAGNAIISCFDYWSLPKEDNDWLMFSSAQIMAQNLIGTSSVMAKREALLEHGGFNESLRSASDWDLWLKLSYSGLCIGDQKELMNYLMRSGSMTRARLKRLQAMETIVRQHQRHFSAAQWALRWAKARIAEGYGEWHNENRQFMKACQAQLTALWLKPSWWSLKILLGYCKRGSHGMFG